jgi:hypothetical protein
LVQNLLIISKRSLLTAPRIIREIEAFKNYFNVIAIGYITDAASTTNLINIKRFDLSNVEKLYRRLLIQIPRLKKLFFDIVYKTEFVKLKNYVEEKKPVVIIVHETEMLPLVFKIKEKTALDFKIIFNAHEYHPLEFDTPKFIRNDKVVFDRLYKNYVTKVDLLVNVCDSIAKQCVIDYNKESIVVPNAALYNADVLVKPANANNIKLIHHGGSIAARKLEVMIEMMDYLPENYTLDFMLVANDPVYYDYLKGLAKKNIRIKFLPVVPFNEIIGFINQYDIGLFILAPTSFNYEVALPNKLYEFVQARLSIAVSPNIEMKNFVIQNKIGVVAKDFSAAEMAKAILELSLEQICAFKQNSANVAQEVSAEKYGAIYLQAIQRLLI